MAASQKIASAVSEGKLKRKASEIEVSKISEKLQQEIVRAAKATNLHKDEAENGIKRAIERRLEAQYRSIIESLGVRLKTLKESYDNVTIELLSKDKKIEELNVTIQVR